MQVPPKVKNVYIRQSSLQGGVEEASIAKAVRTILAEHQENSAEDYNHGDSTFQLVFDSWVDFFDKGAVSSVLDLIRDHPQIVSSGVVFDECSSGDMDLIVDALFQSNNVSKITIISPRRASREEDSRLLGAIAAGLKTSSCLKHLQLHLRNFLSHDDDGGRIILPLLKEAIANSGSLKNLSFVGTRIEKDAVPELSAAFKANVALESITFSGSRLDDRHFAILARSIKGHPTLKKFGIDMDSCKAQTLEAMASVLESPKCQIEKLDIRPSNKLRSVGQSLAAEGDHSEEAQHVISEEEALQKVILSIGKNKSLGHLTVAHRPLSNEALRSLGTMLTENTTLRFLDMSHCQVSDLGLSYFAECLPRMKGLKKLWIQGHQCFGRESVRKLVLEGLRDNMEIVDLILPRQEQSYFYRRFAYYTSLNAAGRRLVQLDMPIHAALWPLVLERANKFVRFTSQDKSRVYTSKEDLLYYMIRNGLVLAGL